jgi:AsmA family/AsmA-like C-terminal region
VNFWRSRRGVVVLCAALLLGLFLFRPGASRLKIRIANTIGQALQRQVEIGSVHLHLLPSPGFDLEDFVVHDDPAFGAEPLLRAQEVTATLRVTALLRARLEVSRLSLTEPSLNLVRNQQGHWNIESIVEHTSQTSAAPTGKTISLARPAFPYIQADRGRINFKLGAEKKPIALSEADYAFWQDSDSSWGMRLKATPIRTDFNLSDSGTVRASGTWQRAGRLRETPLQFTVLWERAQLGQVTKLVSGADRGWRGTVRAVVNLTGEPSDLRVTAAAAIEDFRRYDLPGGDPLRLGTQCEGRYSSVSRDFHDILCSSPIGNGSVTLRGDIQRLATPAAYALTMNVDAVPLSSLLLAARRAKKDLPTDLEAEGSVTFWASIAQRDNPSEGSSFEGSGTTKGFRLQSLSTKTSLTLGAVPLLFTAPSSASEHGRRSVRHENAEPDADGPRLVVGPFHMDPMPGLAVRGVLTSNGYSVTANGDADVKRLLLTARTLGLPGAPPVADGAAKLDLLLAGTWTGFAAARALGTAQLKGGHIELRALNGPVEVASAAIRLKDDRVEVQSLTASLAGSHWKGSLSAPRGCARLAECPISFDLQADEIIPERLRLFADPSRPSPWYRVLAPAAKSGTPLLTQLRATGKLKAARFVLPNLVATHVATNVTVDAGRLHLSDLTADVLGGKHLGSWDVDFTVNPPLYAGNGSFKQVELAQLATAMHDDWLTGTGNGEYRVESHGHSLPELLGTAAGSMKFDIHGGDFPHVIVENDPLQVRRFAGVLTLKDGQFELQHGILDSTSGNYSVMGNASWARQLDFRLASDTASTMTVTGPLASPTVSVQDAPPSRATLEH